MNENEDSAILDAVKAADAAALARLLRDDPSGATVRFAHDKTALHWAAELDHDVIAGMLLDAGSNLEALTTWGMTPLQWAANMGSVRAGRLLLSRGATPNLWVAAGLGLLDRLEGFWGPDGRLLPGAAQTRCREESPGVWAPVAPSTDDADACSDAFYIACRNGHTAVARRLLDKGARVDSRGFFGGTALHWAALHGHGETVQFLLSRGASTDVTDDRFRATPADWAVEGGHPAIAALLRR